MGAAPSLRHPAGGVHRRPPTVSAMSVSPMTARIAVRMKVVPPFPAALLIVPWRLPGESRQGCPFRDLDEERLNNVQDQPTTALSHDLLHFSPIFRVPRSFKKLMTFPSQRDRSPLCCGCI